MEAGAGRQAETDEEAGGGRQVGIDEEAGAGRQVGIDEEAGAGRQVGIDEEAGAGRQVGIDEEAGGRRTLRRPLFSGRAPPDNVGSPLLLLPRSPSPRWHFVANRVATLAP